MIMNKYIKNVCYKFDEKRVTSLVEKETSYTTTKNTPKL